MGYLSAIMRRLLGLIHCCFVKILHFNGFSFSFIEMISPTAKLLITKGGSIRLGSGVGAHRGCEFSANGGNIQIGDGCFFNNGVVIVSHKGILIGEGTVIGPYTQIYDHDHDFNIEGGVAAQCFLENEVIIGKHVWIGANTVILRGTVIGDNCVIGAGCIVKGEIESDTLLIQKRETTYKKIL